jgi:hypothetical protein
VAADDEVLAERITFRVSSADTRLLRRVAGPVSRSLVAREALRIGLQHFAKNPGAVLRLPPTPPGPKPRRKS